MTLFIILYCLSIILCSTGIENINPSSIFRNNKIYIYEPISSTGSDSSITIYNMQDGPISEIKHTEVIFNAGQNYTPQFIDLPNAREDDLWLIGGQTEKGIISNELNSTTWSSQFMNDNQFKFNPTLIPQPKFPNFPKGGYSQVVVNTNNNTVLYVIGGFVYNPEIKLLQLTNYFFKFDFNQNNWEDLSNLTNSILPAIVNHQTIVIEDKYLLVANGQVNNNTKIGNLAPADNTTFFNLADKVYKFDLKELKWSEVSTKTNLSYDEYEGGMAYGASLDYYNGRILSYATLYNIKLDVYDPRIGLLDLNTWEWEWISLKSENGVDNSLQLMFHRTLLIHNQLVLIHGITNQKRDRNIFVIDLKENKFKTTLNYSGNYGQVSKLPTYLIIIIAVICVLAVIIIIFCLWYFLRYKKRKLASSNNNDSKMQEVWANPHNSQIKKEEFISKNGHVEKFSSLSTSEFNGTVTATGNSDGIEADDTTLDLTFFQHEVDLKDMEHKKA